MTKKLFVGNLPTGCTNEDLKSLFETVGQVVECDVLKNFGFVHMATNNQAEDAVERLSGRKLYGNDIRVQFSTSDVRKQPGERPRGGGRGRGRGGGRGGGGRGGGGRGGGGFGGRGGRGGGYKTRGDLEQSRRDERRDRDYYGYGPPRRPPPPDPYYDRYYDDYYRARSRSPPPRRPATPPRYRRRPDSPGRDYPEYPPSRYGEGRSRYPPPPPGSSRYGSPPPRAASAF